MKHNTDMGRRVCHRVLKLARTIAELAGAEQIGAPHLAEAIQYRPRTGQEGWHALNVLDGGMPACQRVS